jgi:ketosteroid isomerase-like protein
VAIEWIDRATPPDGVPYVNEGTHVMILRWGRLTYLHAYLDNQRVAEVCDRLGKASMKEAVAPPIEE